MSDQKNNTQENIKNKSNFSIGFKLGGHFFVKLLSVFIAMDIILVIAATVIFINIAEDNTAELTQLAAVSGWPETTAQNWLNIYGADITLTGAEPRGWELPTALTSFLNDEASHDFRYLYLPPLTNNETFFGWLEQLSYQVRITAGGEPAILSLNLKTPVHIFINIFICLFVLQLLFLLEWLFDSSRIIKKTLRPIGELTKTAQNLNVAHLKSLPPQEMERLAGKLDGINAAKLDTRIPLESTQEELKSLAAAINAMLDRINDSYRAQVRFVSDASHELRTPISVIQGYANLLDRWGKNDEKTRQESIDAIKDEAANMKLIIEQLLFLARGDSNTMTLQMELFDLSELAGEVFREAQMIDAGHTYRFQSLPVFVYADEALIKQAMRILVDNAVKYTPTDGSIKISSSSKDGYASLTIQDDGIGIPPAALPKIFDRFYRAEESRARATGGTGLGLSIADWIIEKHGGHLEVLSRENIGTRITIILPEKTVRQSTEQEPEQHDQKNIYSPANIN